MSKIVPLGIDAATTSGFAVRTPDGFKVWKYHPPVPKRPILAKSTDIIPEIEGAVCAAVENHLLTTIARYGVTHVAIEEPLRPNVEFTKMERNFESDFAGQSFKKVRKGGTTMATMFRAYGIISHMIQVCHRQGIKPELVNQGTWRKTFIGVGRAPEETANKTDWLKNKALERCRSMGIDVKSKDAAEAMGVLWHYLHIIDPQFAVENSGPLLQWA